MNKLETVYVDNLKDMATYVNQNTDVLMKQMAKLEKGMKLLKKQNSMLALTVLGFAGMLYFANKRISKLELKVNTLDDISHFMKEDSSDDSLK